MSLPQFKSICIILLILITSNLFAQRNVFKFTKPFVTGYLEVNSNDFKSVGEYVFGPQKKQLFSIGNIFAANINADSTTGSPVLYFNPKVLDVLSSDKIKYLHSLGIKVLLDVLGNHQNAGWGCFTSYKQADAFAIQVADAVKKYNLDGIDIDDEYSACKNYNDSSLVMVVSALRKRLGTEKLITMVVFNNYNYFHTKYQGKKAGDILDLMIEETYDSNDFMKRLQPFLDAGISKSKLALGTHLENNNQQSVARYVKSNGLACVMVYGVDSNSRNKLSSISNVLFNLPVSVKKIQ